MSPQSRFMKFLRVLEREKEETRTCFPDGAALKLLWRALGVKHSLHVLPGEKILEFGAGSGIFTHPLSCVLRGENPVTAAVFNRQYLNVSPQIANARFVEVADPLRDLPCGEYDYIVGSMMLWHPQFPELLNAMHHLLKPGGRILFFEQNLSNPIVRFRRLFSILPWKLRSFSISPRRILNICSHAGFTHIQVEPYDLMPHLPRNLLLKMQAKVIVFEHLPVLRGLCGRTCISAKKPGDPADRPMPDLAEHSSLFGKVSVVIPCYNEASNIDRVTKRLLCLYGRYIHEIILVNDNSTDETAQVAKRLASRDPRIKLLNRTKPNGVGRALRDGYKAASGEYILSMDCDFDEILPEFRGLFDAVANGADGAIGSRFSQESILVNYPWTKMLCNRALHLLIKIFILPKVRDITNNLKLYRANILKQLQIDSAHFSANLETGVKPMLAGWHVVEVPISWINRTV